MQAEYRDVSCTYASASTSHYHEGKGLNLQVKDP